MTPTLRVIKEAYPRAQITVNTNHPWIFDHNPFVSQVGREREGVFLGYPDPIHCVAPTKHHIHSDWEIICKKYGLETRKPALQPELYGIWKKVERFGVGVQVLHKGHWHKKKVWPYFEDLAALPGYEPIPHMTTPKMLARKIASYSCVVCSEGGISHLAKCFGIPAVVIYGGFADPEWNGYSDQVNITNVMDCSYCYNTSPCEKEPERLCLREISVDQVANAVKERLTVREEE
jgi:hypothetical protein